MRPRKLRRLLVLAAFGAITTGAVSGTAIARADRVDEYTITNAAAICQFLDRNPGVLGVEVALAEIIGNDGFTEGQGGEIVGRAVVGWCPRNMGAIKAYVDKYAQARKVSGGVGGRLPA